MRSLAMCGSIRLVPAFVLLLATSAPPALAAQDGPRKFDKPADAVNALREATQNKDKAALGKLFGPASQDLCSGDDVQDAADFKEFSQLLSQRARPVEQDPAHVILHIGWDNFPFAIPLVKQS